MTVIDASVWVSSLLPTDLNYNISVEYLTQLLLMGEDILGPAILPVEVAGAVARTTGDVQYSSVVVRRLWQIPVMRIVPFDLQRAPLAAKHAAACRLRGADTLYVSLANEFGCPLVTWDHEQLTRGANLVSTFTPLTDPRFS